MFKLPKEARLRAKVGSIPHTTSGSKGKPSEVLFAAGNYVGWCIFFVGF